MPQPDDTDKTGLRALAAARRLAAAADPRGARTAAAGLARQGIGLLTGTLLSTRADAVIAGYWPHGAELDCLPLLEQLHGAGRALVLPVIHEPDQPLVFRSWSPGQPLAPGRLRIPEPLPDAGERRPDILLVPLVAFDRNGQRIGMGGGFYDRTLAALRTADASRAVVAIGVAYAVQEQPAVPVEPHDQPLDWILTEHEAIRCC